MSGYARKDHCDRGLTSLLDPRRALSRHEPSAASGRDHATRPQSCSARTARTGPLRVFFAHLIAFAFAFPILAAAGSAHAIEPMNSAQSGDGCGSLEAQLVQRGEPRLRVELADCYARVGKAASAWSQYREAAVAARDLHAPDLESLARSRAKALEAQLSYVTVNTWKAQEVMVSQDGSPIDEGVLGTAIPLDPGSHVIAASAPGKRGWSKRIELGSHGDHVTVSVPVLPDDVSMSPDLTAVPAPLSRPATAPIVDSLQRALGLVAGAVGIAGVATGALFGVKAASDWSDTKEQCRAFPYCGEEGARLARQAKTSALISTIGFVTGAAGLSGGALLWFTAPRSNEPHERTTASTSLGVGVGNVQLRGSL
jgi:hypothetical protein